MEKRQLVLKDKFLLKDIEKRLDKNWARSPQYSSTIKLTEDEAL